MEDLEDALSTATERPDLERLFDRKVAMPDILRIAGRHISPGRIAALLESADFPRELRKLLDS